jgi:hypothetical protein
MNGSGSPRYGVGYLRSKNITAAFIAWPCKVQERLLSARSYDASDLHDAYEYESKVCLA